MGLPRAAGPSFLTYEDAGPGSPLNPLPESHQGVPTVQGAGSQAIWGCGTQGAGEKLGGKAGTPSWALGLRGTFHCTCTMAAEATCSNVGGRGPPSCPPCT